MMQSYILNLSDLTEEELRQGSIVIGGSDQNVTTLKSVPEAQDLQLFRTDYVVVPWGYEHIDQLLANLDQNIRNVSFQTQRAYRVAAPLDGWLYAFHVLSRIGPMYNEDTDEFDQDVEFDPARYFHGNAIILPWDLAEARVMVKHLQSTKGLRFIKLRDHLLQFEMEILLDDLPEAVVQLS